MLKISALQQLLSQIMQMLLPLPTIKQQSINLRINSKTKQKFYPKTLLKLVLQTTQPLPINTNNKLQA